MNISNQEFQVAMEMLGAEQLPDRKSAAGLNLCFDVGGVHFWYSSWRVCIADSGRRVPKKVFHEAMAVFGEKCPRGNNYSCYWGEIYTVKGILTLAAMLEGRYSKELVDQLTNETYRRLFTCPLIQGDARMPFHKLPAPNMAELRKVLDEYDSAVNPFGNSNIALKDPIEYLSEVEVSLEFGDIYVDLSLSTESASVNFYNKPEGFGCGTDGWNNAEQGKRMSHTSMGHRYNNGTGDKPVDELIFLDHFTRDDKPSGDIHLCVSMMTGLAWRTGCEKQAAPATDEQIATMIYHLERSIAMAKRTIINKMIQKK